MRLRTKIFLPILLLNILLASYIYAFWLPQLLAKAENSYEISLNKHLNSVAEGMVPLLLGKQLDAVHGNLDALLKKNEDWVSIDLIDPEGRLLYPLDASAFPNGHKADDVRILKQDIRYLDTKLGSLVVKVSFAERLLEIREQQVLLFGILSIVSVLFFLTTGLILELLAIRPIKHLAEVSQRLAEGDFEMPLPETGNDEIGTLVKSFVKMRDTISSNIGRLSDANEQLRLDVTERKQAEEERENLINELKDALAKVNTLSGMLPICASCKKIRDDKGYWSGVETYISGHSEVLFSHGICPDCEIKAYEELKKLKNGNT